MPSFARLRLFSLFFLFLLITTSECDWWDDFVNGAHEKIVGAADWLRDKAGPTVREKFNGAKQTLQDPETHEKVQEWVEEKAVPTIKEKFEQFKTFVNDDVMPEVQKVIEAGAEAKKRRHGEDSQEKKEKAKEEE
ncbi:hypothetical protein niasHS_013185 [Heterodera schachtii]|uniref:Uncharacterized protein n=1 Tax=Heterodera schachtii TaxID=97005 RepID=A0ABD2ID44_HETSC